MQSHPSRWKTFVANRTSEILQRYDRSHWHYINTKDNPADFISRGFLPNEILTNELWWKVPTRINLDQPFSLESEQDQNLIQNEAKRSQTCLRTQYLDFSLVNYLSNNQKLYKRILTICSFAMKCLLKCSKKNIANPQKYLEIIERIQNPEHIVLKLVQAEYFSKEIQTLRTNSSLAKDSKIRTLSPFIDGFGILRVGSRLENASTLSYDQKYPIILPSNHQFTRNTIQEAHMATLHGSFKLTFAYIRNKFNILRGKKKKLNFRSDIA